MNENHHFEVATKHTVSNIFSGLTKDSTLKLKKSEEAYRSRQSKPGNDLSLLEIRNNEIRLSSCSDWSCRKFQRKLNSILPVEDRDVIATLITIF